MTEKLSRLAELKKLQTKATPKSNENIEVEQKINNINDYITKNDKYKYDLLGEKIDKILNEISIININLSNLIQSIELTKLKPKKIISSK